MAVVFLFSYIGIPCTYYGSEIGMEGNGDPDCRMTFDWNSDNWDIDMFNFYKKIIKIRKENKPLGYGDISLHEENEMLFIERKFNGEGTITIINNTNSEKKAKIITNAKPLLNSTVIQSDNTVILKPYKSEIFKYEIM